MICVELLCCVLKARRIIHIILLEFGYNYTLLASAQKSHKIIDAESAIMLAKDIQ